MPEKAMTTTDGHTVALATKKTFNSLAERVNSKGCEVVSLAWKAGETAKKAKDALPHGEWLKFVEMHYDVSHDTVTRWIKLYREFDESKLRTVRNLSDAWRMLCPPKQAVTSKVPPKPPPPEPEQPGECVPTSGSDLKIAEMEPDTDDEDTFDEKPTKPPKGNGKPAKQFDRSYWFRQWEQSIGPVVRLVDKIAEGVGEKFDPHHEAIQERLNEATVEMETWMGKSK